MTIAELRGKLSPDRPGGVNEYMEDLLTSDVFGTMKYAGWEHGFLDWLLRAESPPIEPAPPSIRAYLCPKDITGVAYSFWPRLKGGREADVALLFSRREAAPLVILIETKLYSGTSDGEVDQARSPTVLTGNQIADEIRCLCEMTPRACLAWFTSGALAQSRLSATGVQRIHLFVTRHTSLPVTDYDAATSALGALWPLPSYWLSWTSLAGCLQEHLVQSDERLASLLCDLSSLLSYKRLVPFRGFDTTPWLPSAQESSFWHAPSVARWWSGSPLSLATYAPFWSHITASASPRPGPLEYTAQSDGGCQ